MWIIFAIGASIFWGMSYVLSEQIYKHVSVISSLSIMLLVSGLVVGLVGLFSGTLPKDFNTILESNKVLGLVAAGTFFLIIAELCIGFSIVNKNATIAGLIEISYPVFIALFSYLLFKENQINVATAIGGAVVFIGIGIIYWFNR